MTTKKKNKRATGKYECVEYKDENLDGTVFDQRVDCSTFKNCSMRGCVFKDLVFRSDFSNCDLTDSDFQEAKQVIECSFDTSKLDRVQARGVAFPSSKILNSSMDGATLDSALLSEAVLRFTSIKGASVENLDIPVDDDLLAGRRRFGEAYALNYDWHTDTWGPDGYTRVLPLPPQRAPEVKVKGSLNSRDRWQDNVED